MGNLWQPIAGTRFFTRNGTGLYERLTPNLYLRVDDLDEADEVECCRLMSDRDRLSYVNTWQSGLSTQNARQVPAR